MLEPTVVPHGVLAVGKSKNPLGLISLGGSGVIPQQKQVLDIGTAVPRRSKKEQRLHKKTEMHKQIEAMKVHAKTRDV